MKNLKQLLREPQEFYFTERMTAEGANALYTSLLQDGADAIEKLEAENAALLAANMDCILHFDTLKTDYDALKAELAAMKNAAWNPPILIKGATYKSKTHGMVTYVGEDRYMGQLTFKFSSSHGLSYWLPETLEYHLNAAPGAKP